MKVTNYYTLGGFQYAVGDFLPANGHVITEMEWEQGTYKLTVYTGSEPTEFSLKLGEQLKLEDGSYQTINSKYDKEDI